MPSQIFYTDIRTQIESKVKALLNGHEDFLSLMTARSTRAAGDAIQEILGENFKEVIGDLATDYSSAFARRAMADLAFTDTDGFYYMVDVKTHRADTKFNMPNLTSVERICRLYEDDSNYFALLLVRYSVDVTKAIVSDVIFTPIEFLDWDCLAIGALRWGQIQIANSNRVVVKEDYPRKTWMLELCDVMLEFYPKEIAKIGNRMRRFEEIRAYWQAK